MQPTKMLSDRLALLVHLSFSSSLVGPESGLIKAGVTPLYIPSGKVLRAPFAPHQLVAWATEKMRHRLLTLNVAL